MAYTGAGTEANPYLVSTFEDFLTCIAVDGAYIKIISDIDASLEEAYQTSIFGAITFKCARIYADNMTEISNFSVRFPSLFIHSGQSAVSISNINFKDVIYKSDTGNALVFYSSTGKKMLFENCMFSIHGYSGTMAVTLGENAEFDKCYVYIEFQRAAYPSSSQMDSLISASITAADSVFDLSGLTAGASLPKILGTFYYCTLRLHVPTVVFGYTQSVDMFAIMSHDNIVIISCTDTAGNDTPLSWNVSGITVVDSDNSNGTFSSNVLLLTEEQTKSEAYLRNINFIP